MDPIKIVIDQNSSLELSVLIILFVILLSTTPLEIRNSLDNDPQIILSLI